MTQLVNQSFETLREENPPPPEKKSARRGLRGAVSKRAQTRSFRRMSLMDRKRRELQISSVLQDDPRRTTRPSHFSLL
jgi:hypothetical protein